jgi:hypothetical protein
MAFIEGLQQLDAGKFPTPHVGRCTSTGQTAEAVRADISAMLRQNIASKAPASVSAPFWIGFRGPKGLPGRPISAFGGKADMNG